MSESMAKRIERLMPGGIPRWVRCYDNGGTEGETFDQYTVVYTNLREKAPARGYGIYVSMSEYPFHPQGFGQHGESKNGPIDRPTYGHLGRKIKFTDLPDDCQRLVLRDYTEYWDLKLSDPTVQEVLL